MGLTKADVRVCNDIYLPSNYNRYWDYYQDERNQQESCEESGVPGLTPALQRWATCIANNTVVDIEEDQVRESADQWEEWTGQCSNLKAETGSKRWVQ